MGKKHKSPGRRMLETAVREMYDTTFDQLTRRLPVKDLLAIGKIFSNTDYAVRFYNNSNHPKFYLKREELEKAIRRGCVNTFADRYDQVIRYLSWNVEPEYLSPGQPPPALTLGPVYIPNAPTVARSWFYQIRDRYGLGGVCAVLHQWDELFTKDEQTGAYTLSIGDDFVPLQLPPGLFTEHPTCKQQDVTTIPVFAAYEEWAPAADITSDWNNINTETSQPSEEKSGILSLFVLPTCQQCRHALILKYYQDSISDEFPFCVYPNIGSDLKSGSSLESTGYFSDETILDYKIEEHTYEDFTFYENKIKNVFRGLLLAHGSIVENQTRDLEGLAGSPFSKFHGPICPKFIIDEDVFDFEHNGGPYRVIGETQMTFGLENYKAIRDQTLRERKELVRSQTIQKARNLWGYGELKKTIPASKLAMNNINSPLAQEFVAYLAESFSAEELASVDMGGLPINTSNNAYFEVIKRALQLKETSK